MSTVINFELKSMCDNMTLPVFNFGASHECEANEMSKMAGSKNIYFILTLIRERKKLFP